MISIVPLDPSSLRSALRAYWLVARKWDELGGSPTARVGFRQLQLTKPEPRGSQALINLRLGHGSASTCPRRSLVSVNAVRPLRIHASPQRADAIDFEESQFPCSSVKVGTTISMRSPSSSAASSISSSDISWNRDGISAGFESDGT